MSTPPRLLSPESNQLTCVSFLPLSDAISSAWEVVIVKGQPEDVALARLWLYVSAKDVLASAMKLLTLEPLERM